MHKKKDFFCPEIPLTVRCRGRKIVAFLFHFQKSLLSPYPPLKFWGISQKFPTYFTSLHSFPLQPLPSNILTLL